MPDPVERPFLTAFRFEVTLQPRPSSRSVGTLGRASFSEVTGLEINREHTEVREGGYHYGVRQLAGKTTNPVLVLKRGATADHGFWRWMQASLGASYPLPYLDGTITVRDANVSNGGSSVQYRFYAGLAVKAKLADLSGAPSSNVPIEELHIAHEGLERVVGA